MPNAIIATIETGTTLPVAPLLLSVPLKLVAFGDLRLEKGFPFRDRHRITAMLDVGNLLNANPETNFVMRTGSNFRDLISVLEPRVVRVGLRWQF